MAILPLFNGCNPVFHGTTRSGNARVAGHVAIPLDGP